MNSIFQDRMIMLSSLSPDQGGSPGQRDRRLPAERVWRGRRGPRHQRQDQGECSDLLQGLGSSVAPPNACRLWAGDDPVRGGGQRPGVPGQRQEAPRQENKVGNDRRYRSSFLFLLPQRFRCSVSVGLHIHGVAQQRVEIVLCSSNSNPLRLRPSHWKISSQLPADQYW